MIKKKYTLDNGNFELVIEDYRPSIPSPGIPSFMRILSTGNIDVGSAEITYRLNIKDIRFSGTGLCGSG